MEDRRLPKLIGTCPTRCPWNLFLALYLAYYHDEQTETRNFPDAVETDLKLLLVAVFFC